MFNALSDFVIYCRVERRLADLTCKAYERDVRACLQHMRGQGIAALIEIRTPDLRRFLADEATHRPAPSSQSRTPGDDPALVIGVLGRRLSPTIMAAAFTRYAHAAGVPSASASHPTRCATCSPPSF